MGGLLRRAIPRTGLGFAAGGAFTLGLLWRVLYVFVFHPAERFLYKDMELIHRVAVSLFRPGHRPSLVDTLAPPGAPMFFGTLLALDPSYRLVHGAQLLLSALVPVLVAAIALEIYGRRIAAWALIVASLYFPFIDYAGYLLTENPFLFCLCAAVYCWLKLLRSADASHAARWGVAAGLFWGCAAAFKTHGALLCLASCAVAALCGWRTGNRKLLGGFAASVAALVLFLTPLVVRATRLNESRFTFLASNGVFNTYLALLPGVAGGKFHDEKRGYHFEYGSPARWQRGYRDFVDVPYGPYDRAEILELIRQSVRERPMETLRVAVDNFLDLFLHDPWPSAFNGQRRLSSFFQTLFLPFILLPAGLYLWRRRRALRRSESLGELLLVVPVVGMALLSFVTGAEIRYRVPFDGFLILFALCAYLGAEPNQGPTEASA
jgi:4-amino-4-deoxy-L-arabinose transferase-like glycosyltransferase